MVSPRAPEISGQTLSPSPAPHHQRPWRASHDWLLIRPCSLAVASIPRAAGMTPLVLLSFTVVPPVGGALARSSASFTAPAAPRHQPSPATTTAGCRPAPSPCCHLNVKLPRVSLSFWLLMPPWLRLASSSLPRTTLPWRCCRCSCTDPQLSSVASRSSSAARPRHRLVSEHLCKTAGGQRVEFK